MCRDYGLVKELVRQKIMNKIVNSNAKKANKDREKNNSYLKEGLDFKEKLEKKIFERQVTITMNKVS